MERRRRLVVGAAGLAVMLLTTLLVLRLAGSGGGSTPLASAPTTLGSIGGDAADPLAPTAIDPVGPPFPVEASAPAGLDVVPATLPRVPVATIAVPYGAGPGPAPGPPGPGAAATPGPAFTERGVWVVKADGSGPSLVARNATAGVAVGGSWVAFVEGSTLKAAARADLRAVRVLASGVGGTAAQGLPISGGRRGVAFLRDGRAVLLDPGSPAQPVASYDAPGAEAVAAEKDSEGRLVWSDAGGLHLGIPEAVASTAHVERGMLACGAGIVASLQDGDVTTGDGVRLGWGEVDRLQTGPGGLVAARAGRVRFRTAAGEERALLDQASVPVLTAARILYISGGQSLSSASLTGAGATVIARAGSGRTLTNLDVLDDATLVVTVA